MKNLIIIAVLVLTGCSNRVITLHKGDPSVIKFDPVVSEIKQECAMVETEAGSLTIKQPLSKSLLGKVYKKEYFVLGDSSERIVGYIDIRDNIINYDGDKPDTLFFDDLSFGTLSHKLELKSSNTIDLNIMGLVTGATSGMSNMRTDISLDEMHKLRYHKLELVTEDYCDSTDYMIISALYKGGYSYFGKNEITIEAKASWSSLTGSTKGERMSELHDIKTGFIVAELINIKNIKQCRIRETKADSSGIKSFDDPFLKRFEVDDNAYLEESLDLLMEKGWVKKNSTQQ